MPEKQKTVKRKEAIYSQGSEACLLGLILVVVVDAVVPAVGRGAHVKLVKQFHHDDMGCFEFIYEVM